MSTSGIQQELLPDVSESQEITIKFDTTANSLDAVLMANTLLSFNDSVSGIAKFDNIHGTKVEIRDVKTGCIEIGAIVSALQMAGGSLNYLATLWSNLKSLYELYTFLRGQPPKKTIKQEKATLVENNFGQQNNFPNCVFNQYIYSPNPIVGNGDDLLRDSKLSAVSILDKDRNPIISIPRDNFSALVPYKKPAKKPSDQVEIQENLLTIATVNLDNPRKNWKFIDQEGLSFSAKITDESFISQIESGVIAFRQGDKIKCRLEITRSFDASLDVLVIASRKIIEILNYSHRTQFVEPTIPGI